MLRIEYFGVLLLVALIVALFFLGKSASRIWAKMFEAHRSADTDPNATRFILEPDMKKEVRKGFFWLAVLALISYVLANFRISGY